MDSQFYWKNTVSKNYKKENRMNLKTKKKSILSYRIIDENLGNSGFSIVDKVVLSHLNYHTY
jgi:hypothetical protein